ncbi:MAG: aminoglycoside phosphotransferase (APT) family kinase protein [Candidatus Nanohaloarchaea archaeon]
MKIGKVRDWLSENSSRLGMENPRVVEKKSGESNHNFVLKSEEQKYILRVSREVSRENRLENEFEKLGFLEQQEINYVPRNIFFERGSEIGTVLVQTFVGEEDIDSGGMTEKRLRSLARKVAKIHSIPVENYSSYSGKNEAAKTGLKEIFRNDFQKWSKTPYEEYQENAEGPDPRIEKFFRKQKKLLKLVPEAEVERGLVHGDLGFNIRATGNEVFIVDWEFCRVDFPENEILYCFEHEGLEKDQREFFLAEYRKKRELNPVFSRLREIYPGFLAFNDAVWAANRVIIEPEKREEHRRRLEEKLEELEEFYTARDF